MEVYLTIGILLLGAGAAAIGAALLGARAASRRREQLSGSTAPLLPVNLTAVNSAVLVANAGGQLVFVNDVAREWFSLDGGEPDLWLLARRVSPSEAFLELFAAEGQASLLINERSIEATSHCVRVGQGAQFVVVMHEEEPLPALEREERGSARALQALGQVTQAISASLLPGDALQAVLEGVQRMLPHDAAQICLWEADRDLLRPAARSGPQAFVEQMGHESQVCRRGEGFAGRIVDKRRSLLAADVSQHRAAHLPAYAVEPQVGSYLGVPLIAQGRLVGTLELYAAAPGYFTEEDQALLELLGGHAAVAIENARAYSEQAERTSELEGLQQIAATIGELHDPRQFFAHLGQVVADLLGTEMAGLLVFDREREALVAQRPVYGMLDAVAGRFVISLRRGSPARSLWEDVAFWYSNDVLNDRLAAELDLLELAELAGVQAVAMVPLLAGGQRSGALMVCNKLSGEPFVLEDISLLQTYAAQAAILMESARLYQQEQNRVAELEGLQQIVQALGAFTQPEELYAQLTQRIAELMGVGICGVLIHEPEQDRLAARIPFYGVLNEIVAGYTIPVGKRGPGRDLWREGDLFESNHVFTDETIDRLGMREVARRTGMSNTLLAPLSVGGRRFGMLQVANKLDGSDFDDADRRLVVIFAGQAAALIENARLYQNTDTTLRRRSAELRSVSRISRELNATLALDRILEVITAEAQRTEGARWANLIMFEWGNDDTEFIPLRQFGTPLGEQARILEKAAARSGETLMIDDFERVEHYPSPIEGARSALLVPVRFEERVVGVIGLYSDRPRGFSPSAVEYAQALSSQATIAVTNATRHAEQMERSALLRQRAEQLTQIFELGRQLRSDQSLQSNLSSVAHAICETVDFDLTLIGVLDEAKQTLRYEAQASMLESMAVGPLAGHSMEWERVRFYLADDFRMDGTYLVPRKDSADLRALLGLPRAEAAGEAAPGRWNAGDLLLVELRSPGDELLGLLVVDHPRSGLAPTRETIELLSIFASQAALAVESNRLYRSAEARADELSSSLTHLERSYAQLDNLSQELIRKDVELTQVNELLNLRAQRLMALNRILEGVDTTSSPDEVLQSIAAAVVAEMGFDQCVLAGDSEIGLRVIAAAGPLPEKLEQAGLCDEGSPLRAAAESHEVVIHVPGGERGTPAARFAARLGAESFIALPLELGGRSGALLVGSTQRGAAFGEEDRDLFALLAEQIGVEVENAQLYMALQQQAQSASRERDRLQRLHLATTALQQTRDLRDRLTIIARGVRSAGWKRAAVMLIDAEGQISELVTAGYSAAEEPKLRASLLSPEIWLRRFEDPQMDSLLIGTCYYLEHNHPWVAAHVPGITRKDAAAPSDPLRWHPKDQLYVPMYAGAQMIGVINLREPEDGLKPSASSLQPLELFVQQAASALENVRLYNETVALQSYAETVVQSIQQGIVVTDTAGVIESMSAYLHDQYGWGADLVGQNLFEAQPALREQGLAQDLAAVVARGEPVERTDVPYSAQESARLMNVYLYPRYDEQRAVTGVVLLLEDITQRKRLEADIALRGRQLAALSEVSRRVTATLSVEDVVRSVLDQAGVVIANDHIELWLCQPDGEHVELVGAHGPGEEGGTPGLLLEMAAVGLFSEIAATNQPLVVEDAAQAGSGHARLRSWLGVPMVSGGRLLGIVVFEKAEAGFYTPADAQVASAFASQVAVALENARLFEEAAERAAELDSRSQRLALLNRVSATLGSSLDRNSILQAAVDELTQALGASQGRLFLFEQEQAGGRLAIQCPSNPDGSVEELSIPLHDNPAIEHLLEGKAPLVVEDAGSDAALAAMQEAFAGRGVQSALLLPLLTGNVLTGMIAIESTGERRTFEHEQVELAQTIVNQAAISVQNALLFQETVSRQRELSTLFDAGRIASASLDLDTVVSNAAEQMTRALAVEGCFISLLDAGRDALAPLIDYTRGEGARPLEMEDYRRGVSGWPVIARATAERSTHTIMVDSAELSEAEAGWMQRKGMGTALLIPLAVREETIGLVELWDTHPAHQFSAREVRLARALGATVATALENARLHDETARRLEELSIINELSRALTQIISAEDLYQTLHQQIEKMLGARWMTLARRDALTGRLALPLAVRNGKRVQVEPIEYGADPYSYVIEQWEPLLVTRDVDAEFNQLGFDALEPGLKSFVAVPFSSGETIGVLAVEDYEREEAFDEATLRVLSPIAAQAAVSLENARLYGELQLRLSETTTLQEVSRVVNSALDLREIIASVVRELARAFHYPLIGLFTLEGRSLRLQAHHGYEPDEAARLERLPVGTGIVGRAALKGEAQLVQDVARDPDYLLIKDWVRSEVAVPIVSEEQVLGVLAVASGSSSPLDSNDLQLLQTFAGQVATAMVNARLFEQMVQLSAELERRVEERSRELREERDRIDTLYRIAVELTASLDLDRVLNRALELVGEAVGADTGALFLVDPQSDMLIYRASMRFDESLPPGGRQIQLGRHEGLAGWVMDNRQSLVIDNVQTDPRWANVPGTEARRSLLGAPLVANEEVLGCIFFNSDTIGAFHSGHLRLVEAAANQVAASINNAELYRLIRDQAERLGVMLRSQQTEAAKSQAILESIADGVMVSDRAGEIILFNAAAERTLGLRRDEVLGRPASDLSGLYGAGASHWADRMADWRAAPREFQGDYLSAQVELDDRVVSVQVAPVVNGNEYLGLVSVFRDITREVQSDRIKSEFVARVSHELRTPMTSIKGYADLMLLGAAGTINDQQRHFLETVKNNADRLSLLVNDLLDISRIEQGSFELDVRQFSLNDLVEQVMKTFEGRKNSEGRMIDIRAELPEDLPIIEGDYDRLTQVLTNLVSNAYQYTPDEGSVTVSAHVELNGVQIDVVDTGIGISEQDKERVFDRFYRGESNPLVFKTSGTGLGLAIVREMVVMHRGRVWFESEEGKGTTFSVWLPVKHPVSESTTA